MAEILAQSPDYRVLRKLVPRNGRTTRTGILLDVETTGLNTAQDEIIELAMVKVSYLPDDRIGSITGIFSSFNEPSILIPEDIIELTGITDEMVSGQRIDPVAVKAFVSDAVLVIAHNANFDRKFAERCVRAEALGVFSNGSRMAEARLRWISTRVSFGRCRAFSSSASRHR
jgi:DNA polymerase-3 subunit epsilon